MESKDNLILVVDDDPQLSRMLERILQMHGYQVAVACDGPKGLEKARTLRPDLVILDVMMPTMSGYEACRRFKADPSIADIGIMILTARGHTVESEWDGTLSELQSEEQTLAFEAGADAFMSKPVTAKDLIRAIESLISVNGTH